MKTMEATLKSLLNKSVLQSLFGTVSLLALLAYTFVHTGGLLAHYVRPEFVGYIAAFGIEASIVSLSLRIGDMRKSNQSTLFFVFVLVSVMLVSALANVSEGFTVSQGATLTLTTVKQLDVVQAVIGMAATGLISLVTLGLSEIIGTDVKVAVKVTGKERKKQERETDGTTGFASTPDTAAHAREARANGKQEAMDALLTFYADNPGASYAEAGRHIDRSRQTVSGYVDELVSAGRLEKNGAGVEVAG